MTTFFDTITDAPRFGGAITLARKAKITIGVGFHSVLSYKFGHGAAVTETVRLDPVMTPKTKYHLALAETLGLHPQAIRSILVKMIQGLGFHDTRKLARAITILARLGVHASPSPAVRYKRALVQALQFHAHDALFLGGHLSVGMGFHSTVARQYRGTARLLQGLGFSSPTTTHNLLLRLDMVQGIDITDHEILRMLYKGDPLLDQINMFAAYVDPGGGLTTWAINTRTSVVTEYQNYYFNSIVKAGRKYLGADATGLWELNGEFDDTATIPTRVKNGLMQLAGSHFTSFKAAYLGMRITDGATDVILKLHAGDGRTYIYAVQPNNMQTTRVNMGKGLRSRYFSFELITAGEDFDLDTIEFIPIGSKRRV